MDRDIRKQNMIPGSCEEFTRPEEIQALGKYLRELREDYDENLTINEDNLEVHGRRFIETPQNLPDKIEVLNPGGGEVSSLVSSKEWLDNDKSLEGLVTGREGMMKNHNSEPHTLPTDKERLKTNTSFESLPKEKERLGTKDGVDSLGDSRVKIGGDTEGPGRLEDKVEIIEGLNKAIGLESTIIQRSGETREEALSGVLERLGIRDQVGELENHKERLGIEDEKLALSDYLDTLGTKGTDVEDLPKTKESLGLEEERISLVSEEQREKLGNYQDLTPDTLPKKTQSLEGDTKEVKSLEDFKEKLGVHDDIEDLGKTRDTLPGLVSDPKSLPEDRLRLEGKGDDPDLSKHVERIDIPGNSPALSEEKESLGGEQKEVEKLKDFKESLSDSRTTTLSEQIERLRGTGDEVTNLSTHREDLQYSFQPDLSDVKEKIEGETDLVKTLSDQKEILGVSTSVDNLPTDKEPLFERGKEPDELGHLLDDKLSIPGFKEPEELETRKENIPGDNIESDQTLSEFKEPLSRTNEDVELVEDNQKLPIEPREEFLNDYRESMPGGQEDHELSDYKETLPLGDPIEQLSDYREPLGGTEKDVELHDESTLIAIEGDEDEELYGEEVREGLPGNLEDHELSDYRESLPVEDSDVELHTEETSRGLDGNTLNPGEDPNLHDESTKVKPEGDIVDPNLHTEDTSRNLPGNTLDDTREPQLHDESTLIAIEGDEDEELYGEEVREGLPGNLEDHELHDESSRVKRGDGSNEWTEEQGLEDYIDSLEDNREPELYDENNSRGLDGNLIDDTREPFLHDESSRVGRGDGLNEWTDEDGLYDSALGMEGEFKDPELHTSETSKELDGNMIDDQRDPELHDESTRIKPTGEDPEEELYTEETSRGLEGNTLNDTREPELHDESTKIKPEGEDPEEELYTEENSRGLDGNTLSPEDPDDLYDESTRIKPEGEDPEEKLYTEDNSRGLEGNTLSPEDPEELYDESTRIKPEGDLTDPDLHTEETSRDKNKIEEGPKDNADTERPHETWTEDAGLYDAVLGIEGNQGEEWDETLEDYVEVLKDDVVKAEHHPDNYTTSDEWVSDLEDTKVSVEDQNEVGDALEELSSDQLTSFTVAPRPTSYPIQESTTNSQIDQDRGLVVNPEDDSDKEGHKQFDPDAEGSGDDWAAKLKSVMDSRDDTSLYYTNIIKFAQNKEFKNGWGAKVSGLVSAYLSGDKIGQDRAKQFEEALYKTVIVEDAGKVGRDDFLTDNKKENLNYKKGEVSGLNSGTVDMKNYELPSFNLMGNGLNPSSYLRWIAENTVGRVASGSLRALLLDETLALLVLARDEGEKLIHANRDRLPGNDLMSQLTSGGTSLGGAISAGINAGAKALFGGGGPDMTLPNNRPEKGEERKEWKELLSYKSLDYGELQAPKKNFSFKDRYLKGAGIQTTLAELCGTTSVTSVEDMYAALRASPYITTANKVISSDYNPLKVQTLDTNSYWEIIFTPFTGVENGNVSYLPPISEINTWNETYHGIKTMYSTWIPITGFELSKSKLTTKTLPLFDGEITYPISMEFTNEFRLTIADDQFKSWRTYFERCMDVAVYNSELHNAPDYNLDVLSRDNELDLSAFTEQDNGMFGAIKGAINQAVTSANSSVLVGYNNLTAIDKKYHCAAPYKNITFRCTIYCMTPQFSTVSKYDLLLVMKDFVEERSGEIDGDGGDLTVSFSIVGENPSNDRKKLTVNDSTRKSWKTKKTADLKRNNLASIVSSGVSSIVGVIT